METILLSTAGVLIASVLTFYIKKLLQKIYPVVVEIGFPSDRRIKNSFDLTVYNSSFDIAVVVKMSAKYPWLHNFDKCVANLFVNNDNLGITKSPIHGSPFQYDMGIFNPVIGVSQTFLIPVRCLNKVQNFDLLFRVDGAVKAEKILVINRTKEFKRLLVLNYEFPPLGGGASPVSYELAKRLSETGEYDIDVVTMHYKGLLKYEEVNSNMRIHRVACLRSKKEMCYPWEQLTYLVTAYFKCRQLIKKQPFDINHTHFIIPTGILSLVLKKQFGLQYVITSHGSDVPGFNGDRFTILHKFTGPVLRSVTRNAKTIISPSNYLKELILQKIDSSLDSKTVVIPNGFDTTKFTPQPKTKTIFSSGRLLPRKGFQYLIQAVTDENLGWEVHIAGNGPMRAELEEMAKKSKTKVVLHGWLDNNGKEYKDLLEQASIYVLASEKENSSIALLEAMSAGCSVVTTNISGCPETVGDEGIQIASSNYHELNIVLKKLILNPSFAQQTQELMRRRVINFFDWHMVLKEIRSNI